MRVLILGRSGQLAEALQNTVPDGMEVTAWGRKELDLAQVDSIRPALEAFAPQGIVNASAYTAVDQAESDPVNAERINITAVEEVGKIARDLGCPLVHVSTDFVFDGASSRPYQSNAECNPLGVYGQTKREGEKALQRVFPQAAIVRTAWLYRAGAANFLSTMLRLMAERDVLGVVDDQLGTPTSADNLANVLWRVLANRLEGIWHYTEAGTASWYDFACAIYRQARERELLAKDVQINPIKTEAYPTPAVRPSYSVLDSVPLREVLDWPAIHWQDALSEQLAKL